MARSSVGKAGASLSWRLGLSKGQRGGHPEERARGRQEYGVTAAQLEERSRRVAAVMRATRRYIG